MAKKPPEELVKEGIELTSGSSWVLDEIAAFQRGEKRFLDLHLNEEDFGAALEGLNSKTVEGDDILAYHFVNTYTELTVDSDDSLRTGFEGRNRVRVADIFEELADAQDVMSTGMPNDFRATVAIRHGEIALVAGLEKEECPLYCEECVDRMGEPDEFDIYIDDEHSCSHMDGKYDYINKYWLGVMKLNEFEDRPDWVSWDISGLAHQHRTERKLGVKNDTLKLQELEIGDLVRVIAGEGEGSYTYEFDVKSAGIEPTVTIKQTSPDGTVVFLEDFEVILRGSGNWVGREWPLFRYSSSLNDKQILIDFGNLRVGGDIVLYDPNRPHASRMATLMPSISSIELVKGERQWDFPQ